MNIVFIGAGNLATHLATVMHQKGMHIVQVYSHTAENAAVLAKQLGCDSTSGLKQLNPTADLYVFALKDAFLLEVLAQIAPNNGLWVHTAGSVPMDIFAPYASRYGVLYPMQTFSKQRKVNFNEIPLFLEANSEKEEEILKQIAYSITPNIQILSSERRKALHLAAIFACNFTNHCYTLAANLLKEQDVPFEILLPLIQETAEKVLSMPPHTAQTGPAIRYDQNVIESHLQSLTSPNLKNIYQLMSASIHAEALAQTPPTNE
jgi:predicted short-subunit dehydrogenase-like oxidoreductase (DUF2520 family)